MAIVIRVCRKCGAKVFSDAPEGLCTGCVLETALGVLPDTVAAGDDCGSAENPQPNNADGVPQVKITSKVFGTNGQWATQAHLKRFRLEAEAAASLDHPCIVPIYEVGEREGQCYFAMKFVEGGQLDEVVKHTPISIRQGVELVSKVARTVHYAHEHGILHRDIKPGEHPARQ